MAAAVAVRAVIAVETRARAVAVRVVIAVETRVRVAAVRDAIAARVAAVTAEDKTGERLCPFPQFIICYSKM